MITIIFFTDKYQFLQSVVFRKFVAINKRKFNITNNLLKNENK